MRNRHTYLLGLKTEKGSPVPDSLALTTDEKAELGRIRDAAVARHEKRRRAARQAGRINFPMLPYECSAAYEESFRRARRVL